LFVGKFAGTEETENVSPATNDTEFVVSEQVFVPSVIVQVTRR
jgi:hypothetical protein